MTTSVESLPILYDRTQVEDSQKCLRLWWWKYGYKGRGIEAAKRFPPQWELLCGSAVHMGMEYMLTHTAEAGRDCAIAAALNAADWLRTQVSPLINEVEDVAARETLQWELYQQLDLVFALVYGWWASGAFGRFLAEYEPAMIEQEMLYKHNYYYFDETATLMARADIISRRRSNGTYTVHNFKTVSNADKTWREQWKYDQQSLTEVIAAQVLLQHMLDAEAAAIHGEGAKAANQVDVNGASIIGLVKGKRKEYPEGSGKWQHNCPLIYVWYREGSPPMVEPEFYSRFAWTCTEPHPIGKPNKKGEFKMCEGGKEHRLSGVYKARVADVYPGGIAAWIDWLVANDNDLVQQHFLELPAISRSGYDVARWHRQVPPRMVQLHKDAAELNAELAKEDGNVLEILDAKFPMTTGHGNCLRYRPCPMFELCWGNADPDDGDLFQPRVPNHEIEKTRHSN